MCAHNAHTNPSVTAIPVAMGTWRFVTVLATCNVLCEGAIDDWEAEAWHLV